jgi:hypothetical protein
VRRPLILLLLVLAFPAMAGEKLSGEAIREAFQGNTVAGAYSNGGLFSEYHAPDGRALGDNGLTLNVDACWNIDGDAICYHYGPPKDRRTYCFTVEKQGEEYRLSVRDDGRLNAIARIFKGNPENHDDGGRRWSCDDLLAGLASPSALARSSLAGSSLAGPSLAGPSFARR